MKNKEDQVEVKVGILALMNKSLRPLNSKITSLLESHYKEEFVLAKPVEIEILEIRLSIAMLTGYLDELLSQASEAKQELLYLFPEEVHLISTLAKTIESSRTYASSNLSFMEH